MTAVLNLIILISTILLFVYKILNKQFNIIILIIIIYSFINYKSISSKNKEIFILRNSYYKFIKDMSYFVKNQKFIELKDYLKKSRNTSFYKELKKENSDNPSTEFIKQVYNIDDEE